MNSKKKLLFAFLAAMMLAMLMTSSAFAAKAGWSRNGNSVYYYRKTSGGKVQPANGLTKVGKYYYYFRNGEMITGWVNTSAGLRYFRKNGNYKSSLGFMFRNVATKFNGYYYGFAKNGVVLTGYKKVGRYYYYFYNYSTPGYKGIAAVNKWIRIGKYYHYFDSKGREKRNAWVQQKRLNSKGLMVVNHQFYADNHYWYAQKDGSLAKNKWVTIGRDKYYFNSKGHMVTGQVKIGGRNYNFADNGKLIVGSSANSSGVSGGTIASNGKKTILICAGHSRTDAGATSSMGYKEELYTREFASLIVQKLKASGKVNVVYFANGSLNTCIYEQIKLAKKAAGISNQYAVSAETLKNAFRSNPYLGDLSRYAYVLEIHFNATGYANKDVKGDGRYKGVGFYYNNTCGKSVAMEHKIATAIRNLGFAYWCGYPCVSNGLSVGTACARTGANYSLMETAFIDDKDDMNFYFKHKDQMAQIVANYLIAAYGS